MVLKDDRAEKRVEALEIEMEMLNPPADSSKDKSKGASQVSQKFDQLITIVRLHMQMYPLLTMAIGAFIGLLALKHLLFQHKGETVYLPPHLAHHYGDLQSYYDLQVAKIDHWCLKGGNDNCRCDDPTDSLSRHDSPGWTDSHGENKRMASHANANLDVVFLGDETTQAWAGKDTDRSTSGGNMVAGMFNATFKRDRGAGLDGLALGIAGDSIANLLWRLQNGEMPATLQPKVWWILVGSNDLVHGQCSEEAIILGILRLADEIALARPGSVVVIEGLLPRTNSPDGTLGRHHKKRKFHAIHKEKEYVKRDEYPLWPSIEIINQELERFCAKHEHLVYFDAASIFVGTFGNEHFQSSGKGILKELMPDYANLSIKGHEIFLKVISKEVNRIIYDNDEENHKAGEDDKDDKKH